MKKTPTKKLQLNKITVAALTADQLREIAGALPPITKISVCMYQCCYSDYCAGSTGC